MRLEQIGEKKQSSSGKDYREIVVDGKRAKAFGYSLTNVERLSEGDDVEIELSEDGKFVNKIRRGSGAPADKGHMKAATHAAPAAPVENEKDAAVYSRYIVDTYISGKVPTVEAAAELVFTARRLAKEHLQGGVEDDKSKRKTLWSYITKIYPEAERSVPWIRVVDLAIRQKGGYQQMLGDLQAVFDQTKAIQFSPDGTPAIVSL